MSIGVGVGDAAGTGVIVGDVVGVAGTIAWVGVGTCVGTGVGVALQPATRARMMPITATRDASDLPRDMLSPF